MEPTTVLHRLHAWAEETPKAPAQRYKEGGAWKTITAREYRDRVHHLALFLEARGMTREDVGCILSPNCPQWVHLDLATLLVGAKSAGIYPNSNARDIQFVLKLTESKFISVADRAFYEKGAPGAEMRVVVAFDGDTSISSKAVAYETALAEGARLAAQPGAKRFADYLKALDPKEGAFMIFTSGTTGDPKGAVLSHDNLAYTSDLAANAWQLPFVKGSLFSFLPLCHVAEKIHNVGVGVTQRYVVSFCSKFENVAVELPEVQPSLLLCVPRVWEKMMEGVQSKIAAGKGLRKQMAVWALGVGARVAAAKYAGRAPAPLDLMQLKLADRLVLSKVRHALGLARAQTLASGAAALPAHVSRWFRSLGLEILEDFGQTESTGVICMTERGVESAGTVGKPVPGVEFRIADDGELLTRGRHVFVGYFKDPESTLRTLDNDGWLHTGDLGEINEQGLVHIRGRKKELLKTSGGKLVAPLPIEEAIQGASTQVGQVCMVGEGRKFLTALVTLTETALAKLKARAGAGPGAIDGLVVRDTEVLAEIARAVDRVNRSLSSYEQIKRVTVLAREFTIADDEITPTLKMKRGVIEKRYRELIDRMYDEGRAG